MIETIRHFMDSEFANGMVLGFWIGKLCEWLRNRDKP